jgi:DNA-binding response OmpR family regulator
MRNDLSGKRRPEQGAPVNVQENAAHAGRVLIVDADAALYSLIEEWLAADGYKVIAAQGNGGGVVRDQIDLVIIDIPFPRNGGLALVQRIAADYPRTPILALSSNFFAGVESSGAVARTLGVSGVLPKPLKRDALLAAVWKLLQPST